jgi:hypothetical protein
MTTRGVLAGLAVAVAGSASSARAAFPGGNGLIVGAIQRGARWVIVTAQPDGTGVRQLSTGRINALGPVWSPDGAQIAFDRPGPRGGIFLIDANGGGLRRLTLGGGEPAWSPDGSQLVFVRREGKERTPLYGIGADGKLFFRHGRTRLYVIGADGTGERRLAMPASSGQPDQPEWSPNGREIAFTRSYENSSEIAFVGLNGAARGSIRPENHISDYAPSWSPDGNEIAFTIADATDIPAVGVAVASRNGNLLYSLWIPNAVGASLEWTPDGTKLVLVAGPQSGVGFLGPDLGGFTPEPALSPIFSDWQPTCTLTGSEDADTLTATIVNEVICGLGGDDTITGGPGSDRLFGGPGNDTINAQDGAFDVIGCGPGTDDVTADPIDLVGSDCEHVER